MISKRQVLIFETILNSNKFIEVSDLTKLLDKSERTVQYDISNLREYLKDSGIEIRFISSKGFYIPINQIVKAELVLIEMKELIDEEEFVYSKESILHELFLLLTFNKVMSIQKLNEHLYISERLINDYLKELPEFLNEDIIIKNIRNEGYYIEGDEFLIRLKMLDSLEYFFDGSNVLPDKIRRLPESLQKTIRTSQFQNQEKTLKANNMKYHIWLTTEMFNNLLNYLHVYHYRFLHNLSIENKHKYELEPHSLNGLRYIYELFGFDDDTDSNEIYYALEILKRFNIIIKDAEFEYDSLEDLLIEIKEKLETTDYEFNYDNLLEDLRYHFQTLKYREQDLEDDHLILNEIKYRYQEFYLIGQDIASIFEKHFKPLSDIEIAYITIYLYKNSLYKSSNKRVIVVCATGKGLSTLLETRIKRLFPNIDVVDKKSYYQMSNFDRFDGIDFIITTLPLDVKGIETVTISNVLSNADVRKIRNLLEGKSYYAKESLDIANEELGIPDFAKMKHYSETIGNIILDLIELLGQIQERYKIEYDTILGLLVHVVMAIPRWYEGDDEEYEFDEKALIDLEERHPELEKILTEFFEIIEDTLLIHVSKSERYAFYQYILRNEE